MSNWLAYPYHSSEKWIFEQDYNIKILNKIKALVSSRTAYMDENRYVETQEFEEEMKKSTGLWIRQSRQNVDFYKGILPKICYAVENGKQIFYTRDLNEEEEKILRKIVPKHQWLESIHEKTKYSVQNTIFDIDVPVVLLTGVTKKINDFRQVLSIQKKLRDKGYKVKVFSDAKEAELFYDCHWMSMLSSKDKSNSEKIISANHYIKQVELDENPELILIGMMEGTSTLGNECVEDFGVNVYSITQSVRPDCIILNVLYGDYNQNELEQLGKEVSGVAGGDIDFYNITGKVIDSVSTENMNEICTIQLDHELVRKELVRFDNAIVFYAEDESERLADAIVERLAEYADVISI